MTQAQQELRAQQETELMDWYLGRGKGGGRFPDFAAIRAGKDVFEVPCGPMVKRETVLVMLHVPLDIECSKTESGFILVNPAKVV